MRRRWRISTSRLMRSELDNDVRCMIKYPERALTVVLPVRMDNGKINCFVGYRVQHSTSRGPAKGGIRFHPHVLFGRSKGPRNLDDVEVRCRQYPFWGR